MVTNAALIASAIRSTEQAALGDDGELIRSSEDSQPIESYADFEPEKPKHGDHRRITISVPVPDIQSIWSSIKAFLAKLRPILYVGIGFLFHAGLTQFAIQTKEDGHVVAFYTPLGILGGIATAGVLVVIVCWLVWKAGKFFFFPFD